MCTLQLNLPDLRAVNGLHPSPHNSPLSLMHACTQTHTNPAVLAGEHTQAPHACLPPKPQMRAGTRSPCGSMWGGGEVKMQVVSEVSPCMAALCGTDMAGSKSGSDVLSLSMTSTAYMVSWVGASLTGTWLAWGSPRDEGTGIPNPLQGSSSVGKLPLQLPSAHPWSHGGGCRPGRLS